MKNYQLKVKNFNTCTLKYPESQKYQIKKKITVQKKTQIDITNQKVIMENGTNIIMHES